MDIVFTTTDGMTDDKDYPKFRQTAVTLDEEIVLSVRVHGAGRREIMLAGGLDVIDPYLEEWLRATEKYLSALHKFDLDAEESYEELRRQTKAKNAI